MSIQSEIIRINANIANAYTALSSKGAKMPGERNSHNLVEAIGSIPLNAEAMSIETIWAICGYEPNGGLPDGYTPLEYIQSNGTEYIDTGFQPNQDTKVVMDVQSVGVNTADTGQSFFGARNGSAYRFFAFWHRTNAAYYLYYNNTNKSVASDRLTDRMVVTMDKNALYVGASVSVSADYATFECAQNMYLFATNLDGTADYFGVNRVYSCQIYDNGALVRDFVPCTNASGEYGLYDLVNSQFYGNAGSGAFTGG